MTTSISRAAEQICRDGFAVLSQVFTAGQVETILHHWTAALERTEDPAKIRSHGGNIYAARNVLQLWPAAADVWRQAPLPETLAAVLGPAFGLVRVLFFDKPPDQTWALPWHKDLTIAVRDHARPSPHFAHPTRKAGVPHVEAPLDVLLGMLTARIHLDAMTADNGPLKVIPGSHLLGKAPTRGDVPPQTVLGAAGDVLLMRPLLEHSSGRSRPDTYQHRRVLHLEFAASHDLPDGYAWYQFVR